MNMAVKQRISEEMNKIITAECGVNWLEILKGYCMEQSRIHTNHLDTIIRKLECILLSLTDEYKVKS